MGKTFQRRLFGSFILMIIWQISSAFAVSDTIRDETVKTGWTFGALPAIAYNSDEGFRYGALANFYYYGDGTTYPDYLHSLYFEWSRTTKGNGLNNFFYDSEYLIPDTRTTFDLMYLTEQALDFYGFNGYEAPYNLAFEDPEDMGYFSRLYYRHDRKLLRITADFQRDLGVEDWKWLGGVGFFGVQTGPVDVDNLNEGVDPEDDDFLPNASIYNDYVDAGIIPDDLKEGGNTTFLKGGVMHDTRDELANPMSGMWTEGFLMAAPSFMGTGNYGYLQAVFIHRHYFTLIKDRLSLANRLGYQGKLAGNMPFYMFPFIYNSYKTNDGFGGAKTVRGVRRNRIQGEGIAYGNFELRYKALKFHAANQNFYISTSVFADFAMVTQKYDVDYGNTPTTLIVAPQNDTPHWGTGVGLHIVMNRNFVVAVNYGMALDEQDGDSGLYIGLNFLY